MDRNRIAAATLLAAVSFAALAQAPSAAPVAAAASAGAPDSVTLKYKYTPGQVLHYRMTQDMKSATMMGTHSMPMTSHTSAEFTQTVQSVDPKTGNATILVKSSAPKMTMTVNGQTTPMQMPESTAITSTEVISPEGKPVSINMGGALGSQMAASGINPSSVFSGFGQYSAFPDHAVKIGDVWRSTISLGQMGSQMLIKQSLIGVSSLGGRLVANIASRYTMTMNLTPKTGGASGVQMTSLTTGTGHELFDVNAGALTSQTMLTTMDMKAKMPPAMGNGMGAVNTRMTMTMQIQRVGG